MKEQAAESPQIAGLIGTSRGVALRRFALSDLPALREWLLPHQDWHLWDGPYSQKPGPEEVDAACARMRARIETGQVASESPAQRAVITTVEDPRTMLGTVSWHWEAEESDWRRIGITIFDPDIRGRGTGTEALRIWVDHLFATTQIVRLDFSTWSGNLRMIGVGHRLGFVEEGRFRDAREVRGARYDSVVMGVIRGEWMSQPNHSKLA